MFTQLKLKQICWNMNVQNLRKPIKLSTKSILLVFDLDIINDQIKRTPGILPDDIKTTILPTLF